MKEAPATDVDRAALEAVRKVGMIPVEVSLPDWPYDSLDLILFAEYRRVICVETPLSSRKINRSRSILPITSTNSSRRLRFSSVSRSWAWSDFF
jgi:hypothetical protein